MIHFTNLWKAGESYSVLSIFSYFNPRLEKHIFIAYFLDI